MVIRDQIADLLDEVQASKADLPEGSLERTLMTAAESNLTIASHLVFEVNRMRLAELLSD
jgi:hypothetical protein